MGSSSKDPSEAQPPELGHFTLNQAATPFDKVEGG
jgi:hypothetical protein